MIAPTLRLEQRREDHCPFCNAPLGIPPAEECPNCSHLTTEKERPMVDITFEINGKKGKPGSFGDVLSKAVLENVEDKIRAEILTARCPVHGEKPKIKVKGKNISELRIEATACCDEFRNYVEGRLARIL